jgi:hypothetical protein
MAPDACRREGGKIGKVGGVVNAENILKKEK